MSLIELSIIKIRTQYNKNITSFHLYKESLKRSDYKKNLLVEWERKIFTIIKKTHEYYCNIAKTNIPNNNSENIYIYLPICR